MGEQICRESGNFKAIYTLACGQTHPEASFICHSDDEVRHVCCHQSAKCDGAMLKRKTQKPLLSSTIMLGAAGEVVPGKGYQASGDDMLVWKIG